MIQFMIKSRGIALDSRNLCSRESRISSLIWRQLIERMEEIIFHYGADKRYVEIEITESMGDLQMEVVAEGGRNLTGSTRKWEVQRTRIRKAE